MKRGLVSCLIGLAFFFLNNQVVAAENQLFITEEAGQKILSGTIELPAESNVYPGYQFSPVTLSLFNQTSEEQDLSITLRVWSDLPDLEPYLSGKIYCSEKVSTILLGQTGQSEEVSVSAMESIEWSVILSMAGEEAPNAIQKLRGRLFWEVTVEESIEGQGTTGGTGGKKFSLPKTNEQEKTIAISWLGILVVFGVVCRWLLSFPVVTKYGKKSR